MKILALDLGTKCGWATTSNKGKVIKYGTWDLSHSKAAGLGARYKKFGSRLHLEAPDRIFYERVRRHKGTDAAHVYGGFMAVLYQYADSAKIPLDGIEVSAIKKFATGKGIAKKEAMIKAATEAGYEVVDDNMADAIFILKAGLALKEENV